MLFLAVLVVTVVTTTVTMPMEETTTQATSVETAALLLGTMATVVLEETPSEVRFDIAWLCCVCNSNTCIASLLLHGWVAVSSVHCYIAM